MRANPLFKITSRLLPAAACVLVLGVQVRAQSAANTGDLDSKESAAESLAVTTQEELGQIKSLADQVAKVTANELRDRQEIQRLDELLLQSTHTDSNQCPSAGVQLAYLPVSRAAMTVQSVSPRETPDEVEGPSLYDRVAKVEEDEQVTQANVREQSQTKVESGSKYRLRLSGIVLLNMSETRGTVDNSDIPQVALPRGPLDSGATFGGTLRQSQIKIETFGPDLLGAQTSANVSLDFAGGFIAEQNGVSKPLVRLRTASMRMDWPTTSIVVGQESLFFVPLTPSSLASLAVPALAYAGDLWSWTPQVRIEQRLRFSNGNSLTLQGGILDQLTGDVSAAGFEREASWGEKSGQPAYAGRIAWGHPLFGDLLTIGTGGYYGHQFWGFQRHIDAWASTLDVSLPLGKYFDVSTAFYRGRAIGGLGGGIGQTVITTGPLSNAGTIVSGLDSIGGWVQVKFKANARLEFNAALGDDNPFTRELRSLPSTAGYFGAPLSRNFSPFANFIYQVRPDILFSTEYRRIATSFLTTGHSANVIGLNFGYTF